MMFEELKQDKIVFIDNYVRSLIMLFANLRKIKNEMEMLLENVNDRDGAFEQGLLALLRNLASEFYSSCEIVNQMIRTLYREKYRGCEICNGFSSNFKLVYNYNVKKEKPKNKVYEDKLLLKFYSQAENWYVVLHDIRTQETHYYTGKVYFKEGKVYYKNDNRNGISKTLYMNPDKEIDISICSILNLLNEFLKTETEICEIICQSTST